MFNSWFSKLSAAAAQSGRPTWALALEMVHLYRSTARLGFSEYFDFQLYLKDLSLSQKEQFAGWRMQSILEEALIDDYARFLSLDKITMYSLLKSFGLPIPALRAVYKSQRPSGMTQLHSEQELAGYLCQQGNTPVYLKPSLGSYGRGNTLITKAAGNSVTLGDGTQMPIGEFCKSLDDPHGLGWVLQEPLSAHPLIAEKCGAKISGVRIHTFLGAQGAVATKAVWKINVGRDDSDNFQHGASGNMLAAVEMETGRVSRIISGTGSNQVVNPSHPVTGAQLVGFQIPRWPEIKALACEAQLAFPGFICPGWDIAVCEDGPKILEVNYFGDIDLSQHAHRQGFLDERFMALLRGRSLDGLLRGSSEQRNRSTKNERLGRRKHHWPW
jgi:Sugar-transfer associated ATP-grasp